MLNAASENTYEKIPITKYQKTETKKYQKQNIFDKACDPIAGTKY